MTTKFYLFTICIPIIYSLNILVYQPLLLESHVDFMAILADILTREGHNVTLLVSELRPELGHRAKTVNHTVTVPPSIHLKDELSAIDLWRTDASPESQLEVMLAIGRALREQCRSLLISSELIDILRGSSFDIAVHEVFDMCGLAILPLIGLKKHVIVSSTRPMDTVPYYLGALNPLSDAGLLSNLGRSISLLEVPRNVQFVKAFLQFTQMQEDYYRDVLDGLGMRTPLKNIIRTSSSVFTNSHFGIDRSVATGRHFHHFGGISIREQQPLDEEYTDLLSNWPRVVLISFGTAIQSSKMPNSHKFGLLEALAQFPETLFLWKYEEADNFTTHAPKNVVFRRFLPQNDLLNHAKVLVFITHGGQNSLLESARAAVPVVVVPGFGDQFRNAMGIEESGNGIILLKHQLSEPTQLTRSLRKLLEDETFARRCRDISSLFHNPLVHPAEIFARTIEADFRSGHSFSDLPQPIDIILIYDVTINVLGIALTILCIGLAVTYLPLVIKNKKE